MRTLIFGAHGQLGRDLIRVLAGAGEAKGCDLPDVDIRDAPALHHLVESFAPDLIVNAAAYTDVEQAERELEQAFLVNESGARNLAELAVYHQIPIVYFSTDYVFDGTLGRPYEPEDRINPLSVYGKSKAAGEAATRKANPRHFIIRTAWLYGPGGNNFVEKILKASVMQKKLRVVDDEVGSPTHTLDLAEATYALVQTRAYGTYHAVNEGACSRHGLAREILRLTGVNTPIEPCSSGEFPVKAPRPSYSVLSSEKLLLATGHRMRPWEEALRNYVLRREVLV